MLDIRKLGIDLLNRMEHRVAESAETAEEYEYAITCISTLKGLVGLTPLKRGLMATALSGSDYINRERDVVRSMMETVQVKGMME